MQERDQTIQDDTQPYRVTMVVWFLISVGLPLKFVIPHLWDEMWYDEAVTVGTFASLPLEQIVDSYPYPNNHVLFSVLLRPFYLFAEVPWCLRTLSLLCTAATLTLTYACGFRWGGLPAATASTAALGLNQVFLNYCMQIRGYTLSMSLMAALLWYLPDQQYHQSKRRVFAIVLLGAALIYTLPTNLLFVVAGGIASSLIAFSANRSIFTTIRIAVPWVLACVVAACCYIPIMNEVRSISAEAVFTVSGLLAGLSDFAFSILYDQWPLAAWGAGAGFIMMFTRQASFIDRKTWITLPAFLIVPPVVCLVLQIAPFARNFVPVLPVLMLTLALSLVSTGRSLANWIVPGKRISSHLTTAAGLLLVVGISLPGIHSHENRMHQRLLEGRPESLHFVYTHSRFYPNTVVEMLYEVAATRGHFLCLFSDQDQASLGYYLQRWDLPFMYLPPRDQPDAPVELLIIASGPPNYEELANKSGLSIAALQSVPLLKDTGFFQVYRSMSPILRSEIKGSLSP